MNRDERFESVRSLYLNDAIGLVAARITIGSAGWKERWAYRCPRLLGRLSPGAAEERLTGVHPSTRRKQEILADMAATELSIRKQIQEMQGITG